MIKSIFFSQFLPKEGPKVIHQVPSGSIVSSAPNTSPSLFNFDSISSYLIPRQEFCDRPLTITANRYRILGHPICIASPRYERNELIFNLALVLDESAEPTSYLAVVRKLARLLRSLEEEVGWLSREDGEGVPGAMAGKVYNLCEMLLEDLNNYCECMIPIDETNTINIKLFPTYPSPPLVQNHHVPLATLPLHSIVDITWDLTMRSILPHINGLNSISRISEAANADPSLVRKAISHLLYYSCVVLLDIWSFSNIYALTPEVLVLLQDPSMRKECVAYVRTPSATSAIPSTTGSTTTPVQNFSSAITSQPPVDEAAIVQLILRLRQGLSVKAWAIENASLISRGVDVRRLITFGVVKGFVYRVHKYAVLASGRLARRRAGEGEEERLEGMLDGRHCFDEICTELGCGERELLGRLKRFGNVQVVHR
ncbi:MAG: Nitrogen permease regulator 2 [Vezdaea aestivalis]|nr:MAG: Nitrogen permease regulator 2 [Vezdaea aestivalis]